MRRLLQLAVILGVALAVPASPILLAQVQKAEPAPANAKTVVVEKRAVDVKKDAAKVEVQGAAVEVKGAAKVQVKQAVVRDAVAVRRIAANNEPQVQQFIQQFRPAVRAEYYFIRTVCAPTADQRKLIAREGERALREASKAYAEVQGRSVQIRDGRAVYPDPRKLIEDAMARAVKPQLTPEQAAKYQAEFDRRAADRKEAAISNFIAKLDQDLVLGADQRDKVAAALGEHWDETWCQSLETLTYGDQFFPRLPDKLIVPLLDEKQRAVWNGQRQNQSFFFGFVGNMLPEEDPKEDKELVEARVEAAKEHPAPGGAPPGAMPLRVVEPSPAAAKKAAAKK